MGSSDRDSFAGGVGASAWQPSTGTSKVADSDTFHIRYGDSQVGFPEAHSWHGQEQNVGGSVFRGDEKGPDLPSVDDTTEWLTGYLRTVPRKDDTKYGYDFWLRRAIEDWVFETTGQPRNLGVPQNWVDSISPPFLAAAWNLCRLGVLRPGPTLLNGQTIGEGQGYAITPAGHEFLKNTVGAVFVPSDSSRTAKLLMRAGEKFGRVYAVRASEAACCYAAGAYYACCAMVGAAAESIMLAVGAEKLGEDAADKIYYGHAGRRRLEDAILREASTWLQKQFRGHTALIAMWRDQSAHAHDAIFTESEAYMDLRGLLRFATEVSEHWEALTATPA